MWESKRVCGRESLWEERESVRERVWERESECGRERE